MNLQQALKGLGSSPKGAKQPKVINMGKKPIKKKE